jgi:hypothetical protein
MRWALIVVVSALSACAGNGEGLDENGRPLDEQAETDTLQPTFSSIQSKVLTPICTMCHSGAAAPLGLRLDENSSYALLVNAPSVQAPSLLRVEPGDADASYLVQKLEGTATEGGRMPLGQPALPNETIAVIRQWIANGAQDDRVATLSMKVTPRVTLAAVTPRAHDVLSTSPTEIVLQSDAPLDLSLLQAGVVTLRASGGDASFVEGNETTLPLNISMRSAKPTVLVLTPVLANWPNDTFELRVSGTPPVALADIDGQLIDGDRNGNPGGDFILTFTVENAR